MDKIQIKKNMPIDMAKTDNDKPIALTRLRLLNND
jgi:hypothetical protein